MEHAENPDALFFTSMTEAFSVVDAASEDDILNIRQLTERLLEGAHIKRRGAFGYWMDSGVVHVTSEVADAPDNTRFTTALVEFYSYASEETSDDDARDEEEVPYAVLLLDPEETMPERIIMNDEGDVTDEVAVAIATTAMEAADMSETALEKAFFEHIARIASFHFMSEGSLSVGHIEMGTERVCAADVAHAVVAQNSQVFVELQQRVVQTDYATTIAIESMRYVGLDHHDDTGLAYIEITVTHHDEMIRLRISDTNDVVVLPNDEDDVLQELKGLNQEEMEEFYNTLGRDKLPKEDAEYIIAALHDALQK